MTRREKPARTFGLTNSWYPHTGRLADATRLVRTYDMIGTMPPIVRFVATAHGSGSGEYFGGLFDWNDEGKAFAAAVFASPTGRWGTTLDVIELSRLVVAKPVSGAFRLSDLVEYATGMLADLRKADIAIAYADPERLDRGRVYTDAGFWFHGKRDVRGEGSYLDGTYWANRTLNNEYGTSSPERLRRILPGVEIEESVDVGKRIFGMPLSDEGARRYGELNLPDPKPLPGPNAPTGVV